MRRTSNCAVTLALCSFSVIAPTALANSGTALPLDQYQAGTEHTNATIVGNGSFETVMGGQPAGWTLGGRFGVGAPTGPNIEHNGAFSARGVLTFSEIGWYERSVSLQRHTEYTISAYMWGFGTRPGDEAFVEMRDAAGGVASELVLTGYWPEPDAGRGVFMHESFNSGNAEAMTSRVGAAAGPRDMPGGTVPRTLKGQIDNVEITPAATFVPPLPGGGGTSTWNSSGGGSWSSASNWSGPVPDAVGAIANFGSVITSPATVALDSDRTVGSIHFNSANSYTIAGTNTLTLDVPFGSAGLRVGDPGSHEIATPVRLNDNTDVVVSLAGSSLRLSGQVTAAAGVTLTKSGAGVLEMRNVRARGLSVDGTLRVLPNGSSAATSNVATLSIESGGKLDVTNNAFTVDYAPAGPSPFDHVKAKIEQAYNNGAWDAPGITSSMADNATYGVAYAEAWELTNVPTIFGAVDGTAVLFRYTRYGDANLDGVVNLDDFDRLTTHFGQGGYAWWSGGDFTYDGAVNLDDFNRLAANFGLSAPGPTVTPQDWSALASSVPEPVSVLTAAVLFPELLRRRRAAPVH